MKRIIIGFLMLVIALSVWGVTESKEEYMKRMEWFKDAKLGIFIHWGIYSVNGIDESWSFYNNYISYRDYMSQANGFTAKAYKPEKWAKLIKKTGARYAVLTTKHHDGVALWDTKYNNRDIVNLTPAKRDLIAPFCNALRKEGIKVGLYYSLIDWSDENYPNFTISEKRYEEDAEKWSKFVEFYQGQLEELSTTYNPDLYWFDGDWERTAEQWKAKELKEKLLKWNPDVVVNSRLQGYGDYATPEQGVPISKPESEYWELCMTMNDSWGYQGNDRNYKTPYQIIRIFIDCISKGGNLLLDIGPKEDGTIPEEQVEILEELARWNRKHYEAVFESIPGIDTMYTDYPTTLSKDRKTLYLFNPHTPNKYVRIKGLTNKVESCSILGDHHKLSWEKKGNLLFVESEEEYLDPQVTVFKIQLDSEIALTDDYSSNYEVIRTIGATPGSDQIDLMLDFVDMISSGVIDPKLEEKVEQILNEQNKDLDMLQKIRADQDTLQQKNPYTIDKNTPTPFSTPIWFKYRYDELIEAFTNPQPGLPEGYFEGRTSLSENRDVLFLYLPTIPNGPIVLKGIKNKINRIRVVGSGVKLSWKILNKLYWSDVPGIIYINLPPSACDSECTVIAVQLDGEIELQE